MPAPSPDAIIADPPPLNRYRQFPYAVLPFPFEDLAPLLGDSQATATPPEAALE
jgi:hypothetical protein